MVRASLNLSARVFKSSIYFCEKYYTQERYHECRSHLTGTSTRRSLISTSQFEKKAINNISYYMATLKQQLNSKELFKLITDLKICAKLNYPL